MFQSTLFAPAKEGGIWAERMALHEGLVRWVVRRQRLGGIPFEDALHEGRIGLWRAICHYDPSRGTAFSTYAVVAISRAVWRAVAVNRPAAPPSNSLQPLSSPDDDDVVEQLDRDQVSVALLELVDQLPPRQQQVMIAHHGLDGNPPQTFAAIGKVLGVSKQRVHQIHGTALLWLSHPAHSLPLRRLLGRNNRSDYRKAVARQRQVARRYHRKSRGRAKR